MGTEIVKATEVRLPKFVEDAYDTIEGMKQFANMLLESKLVPDSYYEKGIDKKPDYTKGKTSAVVVVLLQAQQLNVPPMTALQHIVPVNGLLSIKGDLAKTMIFASGKLRKDSWKEEVTGSIEQENMVVTITATREDNGLTLSRSFSVDKAKRMGLWITAAQVNGAEGWKYAKSAWYKTPDRMVMYRCLGNIARDLFSDVLLNMYTTEEAVDIVKETEEVIQTESGAKITIPDKEHAKGRSEKMTTRVADKIPDNKFGEVKKDNITDIQPENESVNVENPPEKKEGSPFIPSKGSIETFNGKVVNREENAPEEVKPEVAGQYTLAGMEKMDTKDLLEIINTDTDMIEAMTLLPGKNTNKKCREIIFAHQNDKLTEYVANLLPKPDDAKTEDQSAKPPENVSAGEIQPNKSFDKEKADKEADDFLNGPSKPKEEASSNKYGLTIPEFDKGNEQREFSTMKSLFNLMVSISPPINNTRYLEIAGPMGILPAFPDREQLAKFGTVKIINELLNKN